MLLKRFGQNLLLDAMLLAFGPVFFANKDVKAGAAATVNDKVAAKQPDKDGHGTTTGAVTDAAKATAEQPAAQEKPARPALTVNKLSDIQAKPEAERKELLQKAATRSNVLHGTVGQYVRADGQGTTTNIAEAKRAQGGRGRAIAVYTPGRDPDVVATEELTRMLRLQWAIAARNKVTERMAGRKTPLTEDELIKILRDNNCPPSYISTKKGGKGSGKISARTLAFIQEGPIPVTEAAQQAEAQKLSQQTEKVS